DEHVLRRIGAKQAYRRANSAEQGDPFTARPAVTGAPPNGVHQDAARETAKHDAEQGKTAEKPRFTGADLARLAQKGGEERRIENVRGGAKELLSADQRKPATCQQCPPGHRGCRR